MTSSRGTTISVRPFDKADERFLASIAERLMPGPTASPRSQQILRAFFADLNGDKLLAEQGAEAFVATVGGTPAGVISVRPDMDYFTKHPRAYVEILVVSSEFEGRGVGRALLSHVEQWAREHDFVEVVLDVFADNAHAIAFYERLGFSPDHIRLTKPLD